MKMLSTDSTNRDCLQAVADPEYQTRIDAERCTLEFSRGKGKRLDSGKEPITDSPLFGGNRQGMLIDWENTNA